jgi:hypothetical protein
MAKCVSIPQYPDIVIPPRDRVNDWDLALETHGLPVDTRELSFDAFIFDDGKEIAGLRIVERDVWQGTIRFRLSPAVLRRLGRYSTWRLYERSHIAGEIMRGRIVAPFPVGDLSLPPHWCGVKSRPCRGFTLRTNTRGDGTDGGRT